MDLKTYIQFWRQDFWQSKTIYTERKKSIFEIDFGRLWLEGIRLLVFDVDDTIGEYKGGISQDTFILLQKLKQQGFALALFSNCSHKRTKELNIIFKPLQLFNLDRSDKPNPAGYLEICRHYHLQPKQAAMIGEKLATDMFGAYLADFKARIIVQPYTKTFGGKKASWFERLLRYIENSRL